MKSLIIIFATLLLIIATPFVFEVLDDSLTDSITQSIAGVATGAGEYAENVTLSQDLHSDSVSSVTDVSSNVSSDSPSGSSYNSVSGALEITGLEQSKTRTITVTYNIDTTIIPDGIAVFLGLLRWFYIFLIVGMTGGAIYAFFD